MKHCPHLYVSTKDGKCLDCGLVVIAQVSTPPPGSIVAVPERCLAEITRILNEPGMTWKVRQALLRNLDLNKETINQLVPPPPEGMDFWPGDL